MARDALRALAEVRRSRADQAAATLARASGERLAAASARAEAQRDLAAHVGRTRGSLEEGRSALERGELKAGDLAQLDACSRRSLSDQQDLAVRVRRLAESEKLSTAGERAARDALVARATEAKVTGAVVARRDAELARRAEARAEEAACDAWRPRR